MIKKKEYLPEHLKLKLHSVIQKNAFWGHPENVLVAMLGDSRQEVLKEAAKIILKARNSKKPKTLRKFTLPKLNFQANDYPQLVDWKEIHITSPPIADELTDDDLEDILAGKEDCLESLSPLLHLPCHTLAVERCVKEVSAASSVCGFDAHDGLIRARLLDRKIMSAFDTKAQFKA